MSSLLRKDLWVIQGQAHPHADMTRQGERLFQPTPNQLTVNSSCMYQLIRSERRMQPRLYEMGRNYLYCWHK